MEYARSEALVTTDWLADRLGDKNLVVIDASSHLPWIKRDARREFRLAHIPGARFFDIDDIADKSTSLPHSVPDEATFAAKVGALGISRRHHVLAYDVNGGALAAMRAWWMFRLFGHGHVSVLAGGLDKWRAEGRPVASGDPVIAQASYKGHVNPAALRTIDQVRENLDSRREQIVDVRFTGRFEGTEPEPRPGMRAGHIPGSLNLPYDSLLDAANFSAMLPADELARAIEIAGIDPDRPVVASCGSGVTACVLAFALHLLGKDAAVYDGSWSEWGGRQDTPVETGAPHR